VGTRPQAVSDIEQHTLYLAAESGEIAARFYDAVFETIDAISEQPHAGRVREFPGVAQQGLRSRQVRGFRNCLIFYIVPDEGSMWILRVLHGAMDLDAVFGGEGEGGE
jgi:plasmid stabilization system protein ParE